MVSLVARGTVIGEYHSAIKKCVSFAIAAALFASPVSASAQTAAASPVTNGDRKNASSSATAVIVVPVVGGACRPNGAMVQGKMSGTPGGTPTYQCVNGRWQIAPIP